MARAALAAALCILVAACDKAVEDEAAVAGLSEQNLPQADEDYFKDMDNGVALTPDEVQGRNMWLVWTGGNDRFWDGMGKPTLGGFDLLKIVAPPPGKDMDRQQRWYSLGLVNEPCFDPALPDGDAARFGLRLDMRRADCPPDPFANAQKYPGVKIGARGMTFKDGSSFPVGSYFGEPTGIMGLRLFTNPDFDDAAKAKWDAKRYYSDPAYYSDPNLIKPYRVGMSCGFCHVGPSPINPPADPSNPQFANLNSTVGAQYMWVDRLFLVEPNKANFMYQLVQTYRPGAMDTSLVSTDNINNPRTMNAVYSLKARMEMAKRIGHEELNGGERKNRQFNEFIESGWLTEFFKAPDEVWTPRVLKDGSDSVGALGALNRVYINIGLYSEEWLRHFNAVVGGQPITPIEIATAQENSAYWRATELGTAKTALFFLKAAQPDHLADAPGGEAYLTADDATLAKGREVFANTCARCHSSKSPAPPEDLGLVDCNGPNYMQCFKKWWAWTQTDDYKTQMRAIVDAPDFLTDNYMSTDARIPVTLLRTNVCSPLATNALEDNIWNDFSSTSYKTLPSVGSVTLAGPVRRPQLELRAEGRRPRLHARPVADVAVVDRPLSAQQQRRAILPLSLGRGADEGVRRLDQADAVAGDPRARCRSWATRSTARSTAPTSAASSSSRTIISRRCGSMSDRSPGGSSTSGWTRVDSSNSARSRRARRSICSRISSRSRNRRRRRRSSITMTSCSTCWRP